MEVISLVVSFIALSGVLVIARQKAQSNRRIESRILKLLQRSTDFGQSLDDLRYQIDDLRDRTAALDERMTSLEDTSSTLESGYRHLRKDIELTVERVRVVERDRTRLSSETAANKEHVEGLEIRGNRAETAIEQLVERVRNVERDRTALAQVVRSLQRETRSEMPDHPKAELDLSEALQTIESEV